MDQEALVTETIEAGARFLKEFEKYAAIAAACWILPAEERRWLLYVISEHINDDNFDLAYEEVVRIITRMPDPWLDPFQIYVLGVRDALAIDVLNVRSKYPISKPIWLKDSIFGRIGLATAYVYPLPILASDAVAHA